MKIYTKICGLKTAEDVNTACDAGADYIGFIFYEKSIRYIEPKSAAKLSKNSSEATKKIAVFVNPSDNLLKSIISMVQIDGIQLHGNESPERVKNIKNKTSLITIKGISINDEKDVANSHIYENVADMLLFDAKPPSKNSSPGGNAVSFDWKLLSNNHWNCPWFLSGGLNSENVENAILTSNTRHVDVSSGVEKKFGEKDSEKIKKFISIASKTIK